MGGIHQLVAGFANGDAISNEARVLQRLFRSWGHSSDIVCETTRTLPELRAEAIDIHAFAASCRPDDAVLLHLSIGSVVNSVFASLSCRKAILYHNITPPHYLDLVNKRTAYSLEEGLRQVRELAGAAAVNLADSRFNAAELEALGYRDVKVLPLVLDMNAIRCPPDRHVLRRLDDGLVNVLFVGRCVPNKRLEDVLKAFFYFRRFVEPNSRLVHVGSFAGTERYYHLLVAQAKEWGQSGSVLFAGSVPQAELSAYYRSAALFLCMSEHEGFCIPILESMAHGVPVMAYAAGAVPETMDGAGILFREKQFDLVAEMMGRVVRDTAFRAALVEAQQQRVARYEQRNLAAELEGLLRPVLAPG